MATIYCAGNRSLNSQALTSLTCSATAALAAVLACSGSTHAIEPSHVLHDLAQPATLNRSITAPASQPRWFDGRAGELPLNGTPAWSSTTAALSISGNIARLSSLEATAAAADQAPRVTSLVAKRSQWLAASPHTSATFAARPSTPTATLAADRPRLQPASLTTSATVPATGMARSLFATHAPLTSESFSSSASPSALSTGQQPAGSPLLGR